ncbi:MAG: hypothetical protein CMB98_00540 [Flavobacteriaceae bacterium]|nr:hypothetical protein [Flavobacteriaceae bacterium]
MKDFNVKVSWSTSNVLTWTILFISMGLMIVNLVTIYNIYTVIETMWLEIQQVKETNSYLYQFIEEHRNDFN